MRLLPPMSKKGPRNDREGDFQRPEDQQRQGQPTEEEKEHERDKTKMIELLEYHSVDLIVVAANSLEARRLKRVLEDIAVELKNRSG